MRHRHSVFSGSEPLEDPVEDEGDYLNGGYEAEKQMVCNHLMSAPLFNGIASFPCRSVSVPASMAVFFWGEVTICLSVLEQNV